MLDNILGKIERKELDRFVLSNNGIGYRIYASNYTLSTLETGEVYKIYLEMIVREDSMSLYGFSEEKERDVYRLLTKVKSIGPKVAIGILSGLDIDSLIVAIRNEDINTLTKAPGVGKKTAERIILELRDKTDHIIVEGNSSISSIIRDAEEALEHLGYSPYESRDILEELYQEGMSVEELIRAGLKNLSR